MFKLGGNQFSLGFRRIKTNTPWGRGLCERPDCQECRDAERGTLWNPFSCEVTRDENRNRSPAAILRDVLEGQV